MKVTHHSGRLQIAIRCRIVVSIITVLLGVCDLAVAANAVFTDDGKSVYVVNFDAAVALDRIDLEDGAVTRVKIALEKADVVAGIAAAGNGEFYLITKSALWRWKPGAANAQWIETAPANIELTDVASDVKTGSVLMAVQTKSTTGFYYKPNRNQQMVRVGIRYPPGDEIECPVYMPDGSFLFSADGDLWHGMIDHNKESLDSGSNYTSEDLVAYRYAPMATRETYNGSPVETGVACIALSRRKVYVHFSRMNGSGWGSIQCLNVPVQKAGDWQSMNTAQDTVRTLQTVKELQKASGGIAYLCGAPDGSRVYYGDLGGPHRKNHLIGDDGRIQPMPRMLSAEEIIKKANSIQVAKEAMRVKEKTASAEIKPIQLASVEDIDLVCFMTGMAWFRHGYIEELNPSPGSVCETFFRQGGERRIAEIYLDAVSRYADRVSLRTPVRHYWTENGDRLEIANTELSRVLDSTYLTAKTGTQVMALPQKKQLSWAAGYYLRHCKGDRFHCPNGSWGGAFLEIVKQHGCVVKNLEIDDRTPSVMHFNVVPSAEIRQLWNLANKWSAPRVTWKPEKKTPKDKTD